MLVNGFFPLAVLHEENRVNGQLLTHAGNPGIGHLLPPLFGQVGQPADQGQLDCKAKPVGGSPLLADEDLIRLTKLGIGKQILGSGFKGYALVALPLQLGEKLEGHGEK